MPLTDFVMADCADAKRVGNSPNPTKQFPGLDAKGIDQVKLGKLFAILTGKPYDPAFLTNEASFIYEASEDGPWVQLVPTEMVTRLVALADNEIAKIALEWSKIDEFGQRYSNWSSHDVGTFLKDLVDLSRRAVADGKSILMWSSL